MKKILILKACLLLASYCSFCQDATTPQVYFDGIYIAKTGDIPAAKLEIFTYLKFYDDGTVYLQAVNSNDPLSVSKWFGRDKKYSQKGRYKVSVDSISIKLNNKGTDDAKLEGRVGTIYTGKITQAGQICMVRDKEAEERCFLFYKTPN